MTDTQHITILRRGISPQPQWLCTTPALGAKTDPYNTAGARSVIITAINHECATALSAALGLRLDGRLIKTIQ